MTKVYLIGIGFRPLTLRASALLADCGVILVSSRLREIFARYDEFSSVQGKIELLDSVRETMTFLRQYLEKGETRPAVLLASGDPLFFGIGRLAVSELGAENLEIIPDISSLQAAFAAVKIPWDEALLLSFHGGPDAQKRRDLPWGPEDLPNLIHQQARIAILTDGVNHPGLIARALAGVCGVRIHVACRMSYPDETIISGSPAEIAPGTYAMPNLVILERVSPGLTETSGVFGLTEEEFHHEGGLITKDEIRAVSLHALRLPRRGVFWDVGAGSGAVAIEAAGLCPELTVFAIEAKPRRAEAIRQNRARHGAIRLTVVEGEAPEALASLPPPDRVFIGGNGGRLKEIITLVIKLAAPLVVINAVTWETLSGAMSELEAGGYQVEAKIVSVARLRPLGAARGFEAQNPVFVITARRQP